jgi:hypothetical protein
VDQGRETGRLDHLHGPVMGTLRTHDHRSTWSMFIRGSPAETHVFVPEFLKSLDDVAEVIMQRQLDANYDYTLPAWVDQTWHESDGVEPFIEFVLKKR